MVINKKVRCADKSLEEFSALSWRELVAREVYEGWEYYRDGATLSLSK